MWLELNVDDVQGQWVTYFGECSFIRLKIYYPQPPLVLSVCLGRCEAGACFSLSRFLFLFIVGVECFSPKHHVFLIFGPFVWKLKYVDQLSK